MPEHIYTDENGQTWREILPPSDPDEIAAVTAQWDQIHAALRDANEIVIDTSDPE